MPRRASFPLHPNPFGDAMPDAHDCITTLLVYLAIGSLVWAFVYNLTTSDERAVEVLASIIVITGLWPVYLFKRLRGVAVP